MVRSVSSASPSPSSAPSSPDHVVIDIDALVAQGTSKTHAASPFSPRRTGESSSQAAVDNAAPPRRSAASLKLQGMLIRGANDHFVRAGKQSKAEAAQTSLSFLKLAIPHLVNARRAEQAAYLEQAKQLLAVDGLKQPSAASGTITRDVNGSHSSKDPFVNEVLKFVEAKLPGELARLNIPEGTRLSLPLEATVLLKAKEFEHGCKVRSIDVLDKDQRVSVDVDIDMKTYSARQSIKKGPHGFTEDARLNLDLTPLRAQSASSSRGASDAAEGAQAAHVAPETHPFSFLQDVTYRVESDYQALKQLIEKAFNDHEPADLWPATLELRGRLGAHAINTVFNQKQFDWQLAAAMSLSVVGSTVIAGLVDMLAVKKSVKKLSHVLGKHWSEKSTRMQFVAAIGESSASAAAEIFDSGVVKRVIEKMKGNSLLPESKEEFFGDMKDASISGLIASLGSLPTNFVQISKKGGAIAGNVATNVLGTATSAAMAPLEVAHAKADLAAGVMQQRKDGFFTTPDVSSEHAKIEEAAAALAEEVNREIQGAIEATPGISETIKSMGIGQVISLAANFGVFIPLARAHIITQMMMKMGMIAANTPTEVLSLGTGILTSKFGRLGFTSDADKERLIAALILDKARQRVENVQRGLPDATVEITEDELRKIEHPPIEVTFTTGRHITALMNATVDLFAKIGSREPSLPERVALATARPTIEEV